MAVVGMRRRTNAVGPRHLASRLPDLVVVARLDDLHAVRGDARVTADSVEIIQARYHY